MSAYTLGEAREMLALWKKCERDIASGTAKAYTIGGRSYTALDLEEIAGRVKYFEAEVERLENGRTRRRIRRVVMRDL